MDFPYKTQTQTPDETYALAMSLARLVNPGDILLLQGDLGAGKTLFTRGFCAGLGMTDLWEVDSPTYTVVNHYDVGSGVDHIDLYRFSDSGELDEIGFDEIIAAPTIKIIEWPERLVGYPLSKPVFIIKFQHESELVRSIEIQRYQEATL